MAKRTYSSSLMNRRPDTRSDAPMPSALPDATSIYYAKHAREYFDKTVGTDLSSVRDRLISRMRPGGRILDAGCGSGRDLRAFRLRGFVAMGIDASEPLVRMAEAYSGVPCRVGRLEDLRFDQDFDGIWACASLLHLPKAIVADVVKQMNRALVPGGVLFISVQEGTGEERASDGRFFASYGVDELKDIVESSGFSVEEVWTSADSLSSRRSVNWVNLIGRRSE
jgi:SAM-dependent methyltransferase